MAGGLVGVSWEEFAGLDPFEKGRLLREESRRTMHVLLAQQFDRDFLDSLCDLATTIRRIAKTKSGMLFLKSLLPHRRAMLYFTQPSSRTFLSFVAACQITGMDVAEVRDTSVSSEFKGESKEDSIRTFSSYFDIIIMRSPEAGLAERVAWLLSNTERPVPIVNAGSGKDQHPTQALLDIYTLQRSFAHRGGIEGKRIAFVGDLLRGRTVRSLAMLLVNYPGVEEFFVAPDELQIGEDILRMLEEHGVKYYKSDDLEEVLPLVDAVYMTRVQDEWDRPGDGGVDVSRYRITGENVGRMRADAVIMHPFPRREEISTAVDSDPRAMYWRQMRNGMWIRCALMVRILGVEDEVREYAG